MEEYSPANVTAGFLELDLDGPMASLIPGFDSNDTLFQDNTSTESPLTFNKRRDMPHFLCGESMLLYRFVIQVALTIPVCFVGIVGNSLAFAVLFYQKQKVSTTLLLQALSIADTLLLIMAILLRSLRYIDYCYGLVVLDNFYSMMFVILYPCTYTFRMINTWLTTFLTIDRWIAVCRPLHAQRLVTKKMAMIHLAIVIVGAIVISIPRFFEVDIVRDLEKGTYKTVTTPMSRNIYYTIVYKIVIFLTSMYIVPMVILFILNFKLVMALQRADRDRKELQQCSDAVQQNRNVTAIVVVVVSAFLLCNALPFCSQIIYSIEVARDEVSASFVAARRKISNLSDLMITLNSAINFIIYCACSRKFRKTFVHMFQCKKKSDQKYLTKGATSSVSGLTYLSLTRSRSSSASANRACDRAQTYA